MESPAASQLNAGQLNALDDITGGVVASEGLLQFLETSGSVSDNTRERLSRQLASGAPHVRTTAVKVIRDLKRTAEHRRPAYAPQQPQQPATQAAAPLAAGGVAGFASKAEFYAAQAEARKTHGHWKNDPNFNARLKVTPANVIRI